MSQEKEFVKIEYCCKDMEDAIHGPLNAVHISENRKDMELSPFYMDVETNEGTLPCFLKFCPQCGFKLSNYKDE